MDPNYLGHFANLLFAAAYLVRGILWLRILSIIACIAAVLFNYCAPARPLWVAIYWNIFFVSVNVVQVWILFKEKAGIRFTEEEKELFGTIFREMSPVEFMKILRIGDWETVPEATVLLAKGHRVDRLRLVSNGKVHVNTASGSSTILKDGAFLGEMAFVSGNNSSATVETVSPTRLLSWKFEDLKTLFRVNPEIKSFFLGIISSDLATKLIPSEAPIEPSE
jgi:hypothetical protein